MIDFNGQVVIVTGAGRGLGRLYALDLAQRGASVVVNDVGGTMAGAGPDSSVADQVVKEITSQGGIAVASHDSVDSAQGGAAIVERATHEFGRLDAVVSNAGIFDTLPFDELPPENWLRMLNVHLNGSFYLSQPAYKVMKAQGGGRFVFIASSAGLFGQPNSAHYAAAKAGIIGLANVIAIDGAPHGILANTVLPFGYSRMVTETVGDRDELGDAVPFLRAIEPELVVPMVTYLASPACTFTHQNLFGLCRSLPPGSSSVWPRAGWHPPRRHRQRGGHRSPSRRGSRHRAVYRPRLDLRRSDTDLLTARDSLVAEVNSSASRVFAAVSDERHSLADLIGGLSGRRSWLHQVLCFGWDIKTVAAGHIVSTIVDGSAPLLWQGVRHGSIDRGIDALARRRAVQPASEIAAQLHEVAERPVSPPGVGPLDPLADVLVHSGDIKLPLGLPFDPAQERAVLALDFLTGPWRFAFTRLNLLRGLQLRATNLDRTWRDGAEIRGPVAALMMTACGRTATFNQLDGPGLSILQARLSPDAIDDRH